MNKGEIIVSDDLYNTTLSVGNDGNVLVVDPSTSTGLNWVAASGTSGYSGYSGSSGTIGLTGFSGYSGYSGISGISGDSGTSGYSGAGTSGYSGYSGYSGESGYSGTSGYDTSTFWSATQLTTDRPMSSTTFADVTGLSFSVTANKDYYFEFHAIYTTATTTTGVGYSISGPAGATNGTSWQTHIPVAAGSVTEGSANTFDVGTASLSGGGVNSWYAIVRGIYRTGGVGGSLILREKSEVNNSIITTKSGSWVIYRQLN